VTAKPRAGSEPAMKIAVKRSYSAWWRCSSLLFQNVNLAKLLLNHLAGRRVSVDIYRITLTYNVKLIIFAN
jgi:hypothetical protein